MIMANSRVTAEEAFDRLHEASVRDGVHLRAVAEQIVAGELQDLGPS